MTTNATPPRYETTGVTAQPYAPNGLALVRLTIGAMFVWVFFENLGKGLYTPGGYAGLINYYIKQGHAPAAWKAIMGLAASHAALTAPMQALTESSLGILLVAGLFTRPAAIIAQPLGLGVGHGVDMGAAGSGSRIAGARGGTRGQSLGHRCIAGAAMAVFPMVVI